MSHCATLYFAIHLSSHHSHTNEDIISCCNNTSGLSVCDFTTNIAYIHTRTLATDDLFFCREVLEFLRLLEMTIRKRDV